MSRKEFEGLLLEDLERMSREEIEDVIEWIKSIAIMSLRTKQMFQNNDIFEAFVESDVIVATEKIIRLDRINSVLGFIILKSEDGGECLIVLRTGAYYWVGFVNESLIKDWKRFNAATTKILEKRGYTGITTTDMYTKEGVFRGEKFLFDSLPDYVREELEEE